MPVNALNAGCNRAAIASGRWPLSYLGAKLATNIAVCEPSRGKSQDGSNRPSAAGLSLPLLALALHLLQPLVADAEVVCYLVDDGVSHAPDQVVIASRG